MKTCEHCELSSPGKWYLGLCPLCMRRARLGWIDWTLIAVGVSVLAIFIWFRP